MKKWIYWSCLCVLFSACRMDDDTINTVIDQPTPPVVEINVNAGLTGEVLDEMGEPIEDAIVRIAGEVTTTNEAGLFVFQEMVLNQRGTTVVVEKEGYFNGSSRFFPKEGSTNFSKIILMDQTIIGQLDASTGGSVTSPEGIGLYFPPASIVRLDGTTYSGDFSIAARWLDPESDQIFDLMPGNLQGLDDSGAEVTLISYGMMAVELFDATGEILQLGNGQKAQLRFPLSTNLRQSAPNEIPLWSFDESIGLWQEEAIATLNGNFYEGEVSHFSFLNCDDPFPLIRLEGRMQFMENGTLFPLANVLIKINAGRLGCAYGRTDDQGFFQGKVPLGLSLQMTVIDEYGCNLDQFEQIIGPFSEDTDLGEIDMSTWFAGKFLNVSGTLIDCNMAPLGEVWLKATVGGVNSYYYVEDGNFDIRVLNCNAATTISLQGRNYDDQEASEVLDFPVTTEIETGDIEVCDFAISEFFRVTIDGLEKEFVLMEAQKMSETQLYITSSSATAEKVEMTLYNHNGIGTYDFNNILTFMLDATYSNIGDGDIGALCSGAVPLSCVSIAKFELTDYTGTIGTFVEGNFEGTVDVTDGANNLFSDLPFSGEFSIPLTPF